MEMIINGEQLRDIRAKLNATLRPYATRAEFEGTVVPQDVDLVYAFESGSLYRLVRHAEGDWFSADGQSWSALEVSSAEQILAAKVAAEEAASQAVVSAGEAEAAAASASASQVAVAEAAEAVEAARNEVADASGAASLARTQAVESANAVLAAIGGFIPDVGQIGFASRVAAVTASTLTVWAAGAQISDGRVSYSFVGSGDLIPDMPGWRPAGDWRGAHFGVLPSEPTAPVYCDDQIEALIAAIQAEKPGSVTFEAGLHFCLDGHVLPRDVEYRGVGAVPLHRFGSASASLYGDNIRADGCATFVLCGTGPKAHSVKYATSCPQTGYVHAMTVGRNFANSTDASFRLDDFTNRDAPKANPSTPATPRMFSAGFAFEENFGRIYMENIRVMPSCPGDGEVQGVSGYLDAATIRPYADWDCGVFMTNAWGATMKNCAIVGYYKIKGIFAWGTYADPVISGVTPTGEHGLFEKTQVQCGFGYRDVDLWPVADKTSADIYVRWTSSHQFSPTGGLIRIASSDTFAGDVVYEYSSTTYTSSATPNGVADTLGDGWLILRNIRPQGAGANDTSAIKTVFTGPTGCSKVRQGFSGGPSHTLFDSCIFSDFAHCTGLDEAAPAFNGVGLPGREKYSCAFEASGAPMRALKFINCTFTTSGPRVIHLGAARDFTLIGDNYAEVRPYATTLGGGLTGNRGGVLLAGPSLAFRNECGAAGAAQIKIYGGFLNDVIGMHPVRSARAGSRMDGMTDYCWLGLGLVDLDGVFPANTSNQLQIFGAETQEVRIGRRSAGGALVDYILARTASAVDRLDLMKGQIHILDALGIRPSTNVTLTNGQTSFRWLDVFTQRLRLGTSGNQQVTSGAGDPNGQVSAVVGSMYLRTDGGAGTTLYIKETGTGTTGWVAK